MTGERLLTRSFGLSQVVTWVVSLSEPVPACARRVQMRFHGINVCLLQSMCGCDGSPTSYRTRDLRQHVGRFFGI
jgi:hypothetical protein